jgi:hypothetical protein
MAIFSVKRGPSANLSNLAITDGSFIITTDDQKLYVDLGTSRYSVGDVLTVDALPEVGSANASKFYFLTTDKCMYRVVEGEFVNISKSGVEITTGATNGTINVNGTEVAVFGLGEAAFMDANDIAAKYHEVGSEVELNAIEGAKQGDIAVVKVSIAAATETSPERFEYTGYVYDDGTWKAMDGNYSAENVYFREDITLAGSYTSVGNVSKGGTNKTGTLSAANKSLKDVMLSIFTKELNPGTPTQPAVTLTFDQAGAYEVGESVSPSYKASLSAGSYTYGPATGIVATGWEVTDTNGGSSTEANGSFTAFTVGDDTNYTITAEASHGAGAKANTNLGNETSTQIAAGSKSKTSGAVTGYRKTFHGSAVTPVELTSANIRKMTGINSSTTAFDVTVVEGATQVVVAVPEGLTLKSVADTVAYGTDIVSKFVPSVVAVEGANGYTAKNYNVYVYSPDTGLGANRYEVTVG